jgi:hypothetical protein
MGIKGRILVLPISGSGDCWNNYSKHSNHRWNKQLFEQTGQFLAIERSHSHHRGGPNQQNSQT